MYVFDVGADNKLSNGKLFHNFMIDGVKCGPDGVRADVDGNLWCSSNAGRNVGYSGVTVWSTARQADRAHPAARDLRQRVLRRAEAKPALHGGSQSLYAVYTATQGAAPRRDHRLSSQVERASGIGGQVPFMSPDARGQQHRAPPNFRSALRYRRARYRNEGGTRASIPQPERGVVE